VARFQCFRRSSHGVRWWLLGGDNRVLGMCARDHPDQNAATAEINVVRAVVDVARFELQRGLDGLWWWHMSVADARLARSAQGFARKIDAELSVRRFRERAPEAALDASMMTFQPGHRGRPVVRHHPP
jgi:hypothetical protein